VPGSECALCVSKDSPSQDPRIALPQVRQLSAPTVLGPPALPSGIWRLHITSTSLGALKLRQQARLKGQLASPSFSRGGDTQKGHASGVKSAQLVL
jgi:hypothetical protein